MDSVIRDINLAPQGIQKIDWVEKHMPVLSGIAKQFREEQPFAGLKVVVSVHLEAKTAYLAQVIHEGGGEVYATGSNPLSTQDDVCAGLASRGVTVLATHGCTLEEYHDFQCKALSVKPDVIIDDGGDMVHILHEEHPEWAVNLRGGCEETTTGIIRLRNRAKAGQLRFPMFNINDADCKHLFDNRYGTGQSVWDGIMRTTNLVVAGKYVVVSGYGWCGKGVALRAKGLGAKVIVTEVDPIRALEAVMDGYEVMPMMDAAAIGDIFVSVTGCKDVITLEHCERMKDGAIVSNAGHFNVEIDMEALDRCADEIYKARHNIDAYRLPNGKTIYVIAQGRLVNLAAGDGHPAEIMDMSFAVQAMSAEYLVRTRGQLKPGVVSVPAEIDDNIARRKLKAMGVSIDSLSCSQKEYLNG